MKLREILKDIPIQNTNCDMETEITGVTIDSRRAGGGTLFCAVLGAESKVHGIQYAGMAVENGAACVLCDVECEADLPFVRVADAEAALALASANLYGRCLLYTSNTG